MTVTSPAKVWRWAWECCWARDYNCAIAVCRMLVGKASTEAFPRTCRANRRRQVLSPSASALYQTDDTRRGETAAGGPSASRGSAETRITGRRIDSKGVRVRSSRSASETRS